jgi:chaperonin cofactor prefoldin
VFHGISLSRNKQGTHVNAKVHLATQDDTAFFLQEGFFMMRSSGITVTKIIGHDFEEERARTVLLCGLPLNATARNLEFLLEQEEYQIQSVQVSYSIHNGKSRGFAYVKTASVEAAKALIDKTVEIKLKREIFKLDFNPMTVKLCKVCHLEEHTDDKCPVVQTRRGQTNIKPRTATRTPGKSYAMASGARPASNTAVKQPAKDDRLKALEDKFNSMEDKFNYKFNSMEDKFNSLQATLDTLVQAMSNKPLPVTQSTLVVTESQPEPATDAIKVDTQLEERLFRVENRLDKIEGCMLDLSQKFDALVLMIQAKEANPTPPKTSEVTPSSSRPNTRSTSETAKSKSKAASTSRLPSHV